MKTLHELVADKLDQADPVSRAALLRIPLDNIDRWLATGHWTRGRGQKFSVPLGRKTEYGYNAGKRDTDSGGL